MAGIGAGRPQAVRLLLCPVSDIGDVRPTAGAAFSARASEAFTHRVIDALGNAGFLLLVTGGIAWEALQRFLHPAPVEGVTVFWVGLMGVAVNGDTALLFMRGRKQDLNIRGAFLQLAADAMVSSGVVLAGLGISYMQVEIDPDHPCILAPANVV